MQNTNTKLVASTPLSDFVRNASPSTKKRIYERAMDAATKYQNEIIAKAEALNKANSK